MSFSCSSCGSHDIQIDREKLSFEYAGKKLEVQQQKSYCAGCGVFLGLPSEGRQNSRAIQRAKNVADGLLLGSQIREFRKKYLLDQVTASRLFGGGPTAFAKYEVDEISHTASMDASLRVCMYDPSVLIKFAAVRDVELEADTLAAIHFETADWKSYDFSVARARSTQRRLPSTAGSPAAVVIGDTTILPMADYRRRMDYFSDPLPTEVGVEVAPLEMAS